MPSLLEDSFADDLRRMYHQLMDRTEKIERQLQAGYRPTPREDCVLFQASSTGTLPAATASTTGVTPGKTTTARQLTVNSSDNAVPTSTGRNLTIYNLGGSIAASGIGYAHREFRTGRWVTAGSAGGGAEVFSRVGGGVNATTTNGIGGSSIWHEVVGFAANQNTNANLSWASYSTSGSTDAAEWLTFHEQAYYLVTIEGHYFAAQSTTTPGSWTQNVAMIHPYVLTNGDTFYGTGTQQRCRILYNQILPPSTILTASTNPAGYVPGMAQYVIRPTTGTRMHVRLQWLAGLIPTGAAFECGLHVTKLANTH